MSKPTTSWKDSTEKIGFWCRDGSFGFYGVLWAKDQWWIFPDHRPGMDGPVWLRNECWLNANMVDRAKAIEGIGGLIFGSMNDSEREKYVHAHPSAQSLSDGLRGLALAYERHVMDDVYRILTKDDQETALLHHRHYGSFRIRTDAPMGLA